MKRWPLHPQPDNYETLYFYIQRLARCYGVKYRYFLQKACVLSATELQEFRPNEPTMKVLQRLSDGTGVQIRRLKLMTSCCALKRAVRKVERTMTPDEIREYTERIAKSLSSSST
jgi:hypothetical protein